MLYLIQSRAAKQNRSIACQNHAPHTAMDSKQTVLFIHSNLGRCCSCLTSLSFVDWVWGTEVILSCNATHALILGGLAFLLHFLKLAHFR